MNIHFLISGSINTLTGAFIYEKQIINGLKSRGHNVFIHNIEEVPSYASSQNTEQCKKIMQRVPENETLIIDGQSLPSLCKTMKDLSLNRTLVGLIHLPMSLNPNLTVYQREMVSNQEKEAISNLSSIIASSEFTKELLTQIVSEATKIAVIQPGVQIYPRKTRYASKPSKLLCIANFARSKDHILLVRALSALKSKNWTLDCFGDLDVDRDYLAELQALIRRYGLKDKVLIHAPLTGMELSNAYLNADLLVHPSGFETHGMVLTEALSHGLPVIASTGGGITRTVPAGMGKFFKPGDLYGLITILELLFENPLLYKQLCNESASYHEKAQSWDLSISQFEEMISQGK